jgi:hypothetical protein
MRRYALRDGQWVGSKTFFRAAKAMSAARPRTIDCSLKLFSIAYPYGEGRLVIVS